MISDISECDRTLENANSFDNLTQQRIYYFKTCHANKCFDKMQREIDWNLWLKWTSKILW